MQFYSLKDKKSPGIDSLVPEMFIDGIDTLSPILCLCLIKVFNPESWTNGIIVTVPKNGNINDIINYRGITLTSIFSKIFSIY